ncbi:hypothetical protein D8B30_03825 [Verminephrobacter eiseniae]|nr:hypothetical protein [Verminephrobacter eiseniae]MCW8188976.1 hypothetical protein [Verminephrobacter eiseniae]
MTLDLFGFEDARLNQLNIIQHTTSVITHLEAMQANAMAMCLHMFLLRQEFDVVGDKTWGMFCERNFKKYGLHESGIRAAIRTGKVLANLGHKGHDSTELAQLSRAALFAFGDAPVDVQEKLLADVKETIHDRGKGPTADEIKKRVEELSAEVSDKAGLLKEKDAAIYRLNTALQARETEASQAREEIDRLHRRLQNQAQEVVHQLPKGVKDAEALRQQIEDEITAKRDELMRTDAEITKLRDQHQRLQQQAALRAHAQNALESLEGDLKALTMKYTEVLVEKIRSADRNNIQTLDRLANGLRALADQLSATLV